MRKFFYFVVILTALSLNLCAQDSKTSHNFVVSYGQAGNVSFSYGQIFTHQLVTDDGADVVAGVQQAHLIREDIEAEFCQNDVKPIAGFDFHSLDADGNLIPAGQYDSAHYYPSFFNYDSLTEITLTVWPIYEIYDTLKLSYDQMTERGFEPGRNDLLLNSIHDCDSLMHYMVYVCGFPEVLDGDGNHYSNLWLGYECWTGSNMHTTHYTDGSVAPNMIYSSDMFPSRNTNLNTYGRLYTWQSAVGLPEGSSEQPERTADGNYFVQGVCPIGWHIPTAENANDFSNYAANTLKSENLWLVGGDNTTGFDARPAGMYNPDTERFENLLGITHYWTDCTFSSTAARACSLFYGCNEVISDNFTRNHGFSVRCVKDNVYSDTEWTEELRKTPIDE